MIMIPPFWPRTLTFSVMEKTRHQSCTKPSLSPFSRILHVVLVAPRLRTQAGRPPPYLTCNMSSYERGDLIGKELQVRS